jgi:hypothetical protein
MAYAALEGEIPLIKKMATSLAVVAGIELANGSDLQMAMQDGTLVAFCSIITQTALTELTMLADKLVPSTIVGNFSGINVDIVHDLTAGLLYAFIARYYRLSPLDDYSTIMGFIKSMGFATVSLGIADVISQAI